ncbi:MAG: hypothetical protein IJ079_03685 [Lachnospiraceae bacterium]|nr:hypothetical protein [Lachnospiraceae bacterium]
MSGAKMSSMERQFKITNIHPAFNGVIWFASFLIFFGILAPVLVTTIHSKTVTNVTMLILGILTIVIPILLFAVIRTDVYYDGRYIRLRSFFRKNQIDLQKVKTIDYRLDRGISRNHKYCIRLEFVFQDGIEGEAHTVILQDSAYIDEMDKLIKGDHTDYPLLQLFDDIVVLYPDKKVQNEKGEP